MEFISESPAETMSFAAKIADACHGNEIILLDGELGAGKTTFTKGFAKALGIEQDVTSPTFTLMKTYAGGRVNLYHFDLYRAESEDDVEELGFRDYFEAGGICIIEWNKFSDLPGKVIKISFSYCGDSSRKIVVEGL